jgi:hypothetical protein
MGGAGADYTDNESDTESNFDITDQEGVIERRFDVGDTVLWDGHGQRKDQFSWVPGEVVEVLPRNAYRIESQRGNQSATIVRTVNGDRLISGPASTVADPTDSQVSEEVPTLRRSARIAKRIVEKSKDSQNQNHSTE